MDNRYYENVIGEMKPFLDENGFVPEGNTFKNEKVVVKVEYSEEKQVYNLSVANLGEDGEVGEYRNINSWLFDDSQNAKDALSVGIDFTTSLRKELGIKVKRAVDNKVELPTASKTGSITVTGFAKKMLDIYPVLKEEYKSHISYYGNFLYLNFFGEKLVPLLADTITNGNKKQISKLFDALEDGYVKGSKDTVNTIVAILCAVAYSNNELVGNIKEMLSDNSHFLNSFNTFLPEFSKNKKLKESLIKN